jgi:hypothetical protein
MKNMDYLPKTDRGLMQWVVIFLHYLGTALERLNFPKAIYDALVALSDEFSLKLDAAENPATRTKLSVQAKNTVRTTLKAKVRLSVKEYLTYNHAVTDEDRDGLGIPIHKTTRTPSQVATTYPDYDIDSGTIRRLILNFYDQGQKKSKAKPDGQHCAEIRWAMRDTPPASLKDLVNSSVDTHTPFTLEFDENERGKTVYFCLCWENTRGEKGPWSEIMSAIIP